MAAFCLLTGQTPAVYTQLTRLEREAFIKLATSRKR